MKGIRYFCATLLSCAVSGAFAAGAEVYGPFTVPPAGIDVDAASHRIGSMPAADLSALRAAAGELDNAQATTPASIQILTQASDASPNFGLSPGSDGSGGDECFAGIGEPYPTPSGGECVNSRRKQNQSYPWGVAQVKLPDSEPGEGHRLWFGTVANPACVTGGFGLGSFEPTPAEYDAEPFPLEASATPVADPAPAPGCVFEEGVDTVWQCPAPNSPEYFCEFGESQIAKELGFRAPSGDWRQPRVYELNRDTGVLTDYTPAGSAAAAAASQLTGFRFCAPTPDQQVVFCGGPALGFGVLILAFDTSGEGPRYIGSRQYGGYVNVRKGFNFGTPANLYLGVRSASGDTGRLLRWTGSTAPSQFPELRRLQVFQFQEVGMLDGDPREFTLVGPDTEGRYRIAASTTQPSFDPGEASGVWLSPLFGEAGLTTADAGNWQKVFDFGAYEPDRALLANTSGGAIVAFNADGYLYWSSLHVAGYGATLHTYCLASYCAGFGYSLRQPARLLLLTNRAATFWRAPIQPDLGIDTAAIELLCGEPTLPTWSDAAGDFVDVATGWTPSYPSPTGDGPCGMGMSVAGQLKAEEAPYLDYLYLSSYSWAANLNNPANPADQRMCFGTLDLGYTIFGQDSRSQWGADLYCHAPGGNQFYVADTGGAGNGLNYGYRIVRPDEADPTGTRFLVGMANPFSLELSQLESRNGTPWPNNHADTGWTGGWNIRSITVDPGPAVPSGL
ncbi:hypothetical protein E4634_16975 [Mangrovimicrobium sediminis]|uniref:Uncharacterized protein n=1 Tax=Mangrovimicrobium sediminis TaxID=2562682 RepID=A0A4Z0LXD2_9GAMM|nr:hypothetical protein [Haliea sp. SAOS-164]TGD71808.1 hypothetical protein E4634_16975 [Haliea sp. SAOS-164]